MKEKKVLIVLAIVASMLLMVVPVSAWDYANTSVQNPQTDTLSEAFGPRADRVQIIMYKDELAEFTALELGQLDLTDWPVDSAHYVPWTTAPKNASIAVVDTGPEFGMYILDMRMNNETRIYKQVGKDVYADLGPNPAYTAAFGNPMADVWLRRAIAACVDRKYVVEQAVSGGALPLLGQALYSVVNDPPYKGWGNPELNPGGALKELTYAYSNGSANVALAKKFLDEHGYSTMVGGYRTKNGVSFQLEIVVRQDHTYRKLFGEDLVTKLTNDLKLNVKLTYKTSAGARSYTMADKNGHMYTGGWGLTSDPDHLYYLFHINNYFHPGRPMNYMYYPGDYAQITVPYDGWQYTDANVPGLKVLVDWGTLPYYLDFSDTGKSWNKNDKVWKNPQNYWSWEMMIATTSARAKTAARKSEEALAYFVDGSPVWASRSFTAFKRTYAGTPGTPDGEDKYETQLWKGVVNQAGFGVWGGYSFYNMHTANAAFGDGNMTIRWGFRQPTMSLNPIYAEWIWDWYVLSRSYDSLIGLDPYDTSIDMPALASDWKVETWDASGLGLGTCTKVTFFLRHDLYWSDGVPLTASDVVFSWGGRKVPGSIANLLFAKGYPPAYWDGQIADMLSVAAPDPFTVVVYLDVYAFFGLHSMSGFNIVLPEHIWKPIIETGDPTLPWGQPNVCSGAWKIRSTAEPTVDIWLDKNTMHYQYRNPLNIWTKQESKRASTPLGGNAHWLVPPETTMNINVTVYLHYKQIFETGPYKEDVYPWTKVDVVKNVQLWIWNGQGNPADKTKYVLNKTLETDVVVNLTRCEVVSEKFQLTNVKPWWYLVKVSVLINSTYISTDGVHWTKVTPDTLNPFFGKICTYDEYMIVTMRYDIAGQNFKKLPTPKYQAISDLVVDGSDLIAAARAFGSYPGQSRWNPQCDINGDFVVDGSDLILIARRFGWGAVYPGPS